MAVIYDDAHAVNSSQVAVIVKLEAIQDPPQVSAYYLSIARTNGSGASQLLRWDSPDERDRFYKELITAMAQ